MRWRGAIVAVTLQLAFTCATAAAVPDPERGEQWDLDAIHADAAHRISIGTGATVAVLDSGVQANHPDLAGSVISGPDLIDGDRTPDDENGHGTNVAGIIVAHVDNGIGIEGAAPGAKVLAIRILDAHNQGSTTQEIAGINAAVAAGAQVIINLSLNPGLGFIQQLLPSDPLIRALEAAANAGVVIVAAAGNDSIPLCNQPILTTKIICVGSTNRDGVRSSFSNYAVRVDMVAPGGELRPGEAITSTQLGGGYSAMAGTSQAAPHVAAAAALRVSLGLRGSAVIDRLEQTATPLPNALQLGHGLLNMEAAVAGLGPPLEPAAGAPPSAAALSASVSKRVRYATVRDRGIGVTCTSPVTGTCQVRVTRRRLLARGSRHVETGVPTKVRARLTKAGRQALAGAASIDVRVTVTVEGAGYVRLSTTLVRN